MLGQDLSRLFPKNGLTQLKAEMEDARSRGADLRGGGGDSARSQRQAMITGPQIMAARKLLGWSIRDLSRHAGMEIADVQDTEASVGSPKRHLTNLAVIRRALALLWQI
jgi:hypothetical protein